MQGLLNCRVSSALVCGSLGRCGLPVVVLFLVSVGGCTSQEQSSGEGDASPAPAQRAEDLLHTLWRPQPGQVALTDPLELDQGRLQIPTPEDWELRKMPDYLLVCHRGNYPRIYVSVTDDPAFTNTTPANVFFYAEAAAKKLADKKLAVPVRPVQVGNFVGVSYGWEATAKGKRLVRFFLVTTQGQRRYTIELRCLEATYDSYRDTALAVAAAVRFDEDKAASGSQKAPDSPKDSGSAPATKDGSGES